MVFIEMADYFRYQQIRKATVQVTRERDAVESIAVSGPINVHNIIEAVAVYVSVRRAPP